MLRNATGALALVLLAATTQAQPASPLRDVNPSAGFGSSPMEFTSVAGVTYFAASDAANGWEVWRTDGTAAGTRILKDMRPGSGGSNPRELTDFEGRLFFVADGSLWRSNGTTSGTVRLHPELTNARFLAVHDGRLYFAADDGIHGQELWRTDGTETGAVLVKDVAGGPADSGPEEMTVFGTFVYFAATGPGGRELWRTDGSDAGTLQVWDVAQGTAGSSPLSLRVVGARLFFAADDGVHGREPWVLDAASGVTALVRDIAPGPSTSTFGGFVQYGNDVYFNAFDPAHGYEPWRSDGTAGGTFLVRDLIPGIEGTFPRDFEVVQGNLYFAADAASGGGWLWRTDGTATGTTVVDPQVRDPFFLTEHDGRLLFSARDQSHGRELWTSDGTAAGTTLLDLRAGPDGSEPSELASIDGQLYFAAKPPQGGLFSTFEPWISDGTPAGTTLLASLGGGASSQIREWGVLGGRAFFAATDGVHGRELWTSDGTPDGTRLLADLHPGPASSDPEQFTRIGDVLFFTAYEDLYQLLWRTDGTAAGTYRVTGVTHPVLFVGEIARVGATLFLDGYDEAHGQELWKSDGTPAGTVLVADLAADVGYNGPRSLTDVNGTLFFDGYDATEGRALWKSDGTAAGTVRVDVVLPGPASAVIKGLTAVGGLLYFAADDGLHGLEPWISTGAPLGTNMLRDVRPGPPGSAPHAFTALGSTALFLADDGTSGIEPWRSTDGSEAGTVRLADIRPGAQGSEPRRLVTIDGGVAVFDADDGSSGRELWRTDGTPAGTHRVADLAPGPEPSLDATDPPIAAWGGRAFFAASDVEHGQELWRTDGTAGGTTLLQDLAPGPGSSSPQAVAAAGGLLFFTAVDAAGREPWVLRPELTVANATAAEGTHALVEVTLVPRLDVPLAAPFATVDNSAVGGSDFQAKSGVLTFPPGETLQTVDVTVLDDVTTETIEQFFVDVAPGASAFAARPRGIVTVLDDDVAPTLTAGDAAVVEGDAGPTNATFTVRLAPVSATAVTVAYATAPGTAGASDFGGVAGTLTFPPGTAARTVTVPVIGDVLDEPDEFFFLRLSDAAGGTAASGDGVGRIVDDDGAAIRLEALDRGATVLASLEAAPGPAADVDLYALERAAFSSYEITVDGASGDVGDAGPAVELVASDLVTTVPSVASGVGHARALRTLNGTAAARHDYVRVRSLGCATDCGADDTYRIRVRETTLRASRFNDSGGQRTVLILQNRGEAPVTALASYWRADGTRLAGSQVVLPPHGTAIVATPAAASGASGSITVAHDGALGALAGKAVSLDEATGLAFDTPLEARPR
jgi:ELWxxDGT repeat protein